MSSKSASLNILPQNNRRYIFAIFGFCLAVFGIVHGIYWESLCNIFLEKSMVLSPGSKTYEIWKNPPLTMTIDMYFWNWTNPQDFHNTSIKPILKELGPYRFVEKPDKVNIVWHPENASVTFHKLNYYYFDRAGSVGDVTDSIVTVNPLAVAVATKSKIWNSMRRTIVDIALKVYGDQLSVEKTVDELIFNGYDDVLLNVANVVPNSISDLIVPGDRFGYCYPRNGTVTYSGTWNMHTGADDIRKLGEMHTWNYKTSEQYATSSECAKSFIHGSAGEFQPPFLQENGTIEIFLSDLCRPIKLEYVETVEIEGVKGFKYIGGLKAVDNGTLYPENVCYCLGECAPSGVINISSCWYESAVFMSYPHFYKADPYYLEQVEGLSPRQDIHEFSIVLEPKTGLIMDVTGRFQVSLLVQPMPWLRMFRNVRKIFFPIFWFEVTTHITPELADELKLFPKLLLAGKIFGGLCCITGLLLFLWQMYVKQHLKKRLQQQIEINDVEKEQPHITMKDKEAPRLLEKMTNSARIYPKAISMESEKNTITTIMSNNSTFGSAPTLSS